MTRYKQSFYTTSDKKKLFVQEWIPEKDPKSLILHVHGLGEHSGRMEHWAERFVNMQVGFISYDQRGHGKADGKRGHPTNVKYLIDDVKSLVEMIRKDYPNIPLILYGHSMGGSVAINYVISTTNTVDGLIATSPWLKLANPPSPALVKLMKPLSKMVPGISISNGLDAKDISSDEQEVVNYSEDPLVHPKISLGLANSLFEAGLNALRNVYKINCPFLLMHGTGDNITSAKASEEYVMNTSDRTTLKLWDNAYHELHNEPIREEVFAFIIDWLKQYKFL